VTAVVVLIVGVCGWPTLRVPYHKWRWEASRNAARRSIDGQFTVADHLRTVVGREPQTWEDHYKTAAEHEQALIRLKYLVRKEFPLRHPISSAKLSERFYYAATNRFPNRLEWTWELSEAADTVTITTTPKRMVEWEQFIREFDAVKKAKAYRKCKRKRNWMEAVMPVKF